MSGMIREEAIRCLKVIDIICKERIWDYGEVEHRAMLMAIADMEKQIQWQKTERFNRMIEAFECDFDLIMQGEKTFAELDRNMKDKRYSLAEDMELMQELSTLLRYGKAEICVKGE